MTGSARRCDVLERFLLSCNPIENKEALVIEALSKELGGVDDAIRYCLTCLFRFELDRELRDSDLHVVQLKNYTYFMPNTLPDYAMGIAYRYAKREAPWRPIKYYGKRVWISYHFCSTRVYEKENMKKEAIRKNSIQSGWVPILFIAIAFFPLITLFSAFCSILCYLVV